MTTTASLTPTLSEFKDLVRALEKSKNYIEEHELLSDEELNTLKQTSSLVAKFQKEALTERENRRSAELQAQEKGRLVSDAWKIVTALKKDKYDLETQLEKMKKNRSASNMDRIMKDSLDQIITRKKAELSSHENDKKDNKKGTPKDDDFPDGVTPSSSTESKEKQDSIKESSEQSEDSDSLIEDLRRILCENSSSDEVEEEELRTHGIQDFTNKHYSPSDMIKMFTAKPYLQPKNTLATNTEGLEQQELNPHRTKEGYWLARNSNPSRSPEGKKSSFPSQANKAAFKRSYKTKANEAIHFDAHGYPVNVEVNIPKLPFEDESENTEDCHETKGIAKYPSSQNYESESAEDRDEDESIIKGESMKTSGLEAAEERQRSKRSPRHEASKKYASQSAEYGKRFHPINRDEYAKSYVAESTQYCTKDHSIPKFEILNDHRSLDTEERQEGKRIPRYGTEKNYASDTARGRKQTQDLIPKYDVKDNGLEPKCFLQRKTNYLYSEGGDRYGRHAPKVVSPLVHNTCSLNGEAQLSQNRLRKELTKENLKKLEKEQLKSADNKISNIDSHVKLIDGASGLPGGIVSKRIQDLAKRLRIGHSKKNPKRIPYSDSVHYRNPAPGLCGLENLGNSCFMNAGLQCLLVIKPFYRFFLEGGHRDILQLKIKEDKNLSLCELLGRLTEKVFSGCYLTCEPSALFTSLQTLFPELDGFIQHDCQEFLALFLDAIHLELNTAQANHRRRIRGLTMSGAKTADQWWRLYNEENESVIVDTFQGQFRNKIRCSVCSHVSMTYQAFSFLSLPLVSQKFQTFVITFVRNNHAETIKSGKPRAIRVRVQASKPATTIQVKQRLVSLFPVNEQPDFENLFLAVVRDSAIVGLLHDQRVISPFSDKQTKLYAYEPLHSPTLPSESTSNKDKLPKTSKMSRRKTTSELHDTSGGLRNDNNTKLIPLDSITRASSVKGSYACNSKKGRAKTRASLPVGYHMTSTCSICLQARPTRQLLEHQECGKVFCLDCLDVSIPDDSTQCPDCGIPSSTGDSGELKIQFCNVPVLFRHKESDEEECSLFGHPNLVTLPCKIAGQDLYNHMTTLLPGSFNIKKTRHIESLPFSLLLVNYQGKRCSRCDEDCAGCYIRDDDEVVFENGDHLAIQLINIIQLEVDKMSRYCDHESMRVKHLTCKLQLQDCLRSFVDREQLEDLWDCPKCNQERSATKSMSFCRYPDTLIIHLKRYRQSNMKIYTPVEFPLEDLDMNEFMHGINSPRDVVCAGDNMYDLMGIVCHDGDFESGHYKAYTRHGITSEWHLFDDYKVSQESPSSICHMTAYLLFYNRRASSPLCTSINEDVTVAVRSKTSEQPRRRISESKPRTLDDQNVQKRNASTETKQAVLLPSKAQTAEELEYVMNASHSALKDFSSTPKERVLEEHQHPKARKEKPQSQRESYVDHSNDEPVQCDCSQCDYYRELEQQIRSCRGYISGSEIRSKVGSSDPSSRGVSPKTKQSKAPPIKRVKHTSLEEQTQAHEHKEKTPQLASSDSVDSELLVHEDNKPRRRSKRRSSRQLLNVASSISNSEPITRRQLDEEGTNQKESGTDVSGVTDSAVQCTLMNDDNEHRRRSTRSNAVQVSLLSEQHEGDTSQHNEEKSDDGVLDQEAVKFLTRKLVHAVESEDMKQAIHLLNEGADPSLLIDGISPLHLSAGMKSSLSFHFTRLFLDYGANPNVRSTEGLTPVHVASVWGKKDCLKLLLKKGGNPYSEDSEGRTAIELANDFEHETSANTSEYLNKLDQHYTSIIHSQTCSNTSLTSEISVSELDYMPYIHGEEGNRPRRVRRQLEEIVGPDMSGGSVVGCGSWTKGFKRKVRRNKAVRTMSGSLRKTSSRLAERFRSFSDHFSSHSSDNI